MVTLVNNEVRYCSNLRRATQFTRLPNVRGVHDLTRRDLGGGSSGPSISKGVSLLLSSFAFLPFHRFVGITVNGIFLCV